MPSNGTCCCAGRSSCHFKTPSPGGLNHRHSRLTVRRLEAQDQGDQVTARLVSSEASPLAGRRPLSPGPPGVSSVRALPSLPNPPLLTRTPVRLGKDPLVPLTVTLIPFPKILYLQIQSHAQVLGAQHTNGGGQRNRDTIHSRIPVRCWESAQREQTENLWF